jgi:glycosyltransferase involved in cell wall biosynthesis
VLAAVTTNLRVLYFGTYERNYPRNAQVIACLRKAGVEVSERHASVWDGREHKFAAGAGTALRLARAELSLLRRPHVDFDALLVGYPGHFDLLAAKRAARGKPLVFNPLVSLADTLVEDRARFAAGSLPARALRTLDRAAFRAADLVVADTQTHAEFFRELGARRVEVCLVGAEERVFAPGWRQPADFNCLFVGKLIPLHGLETILEAARRAPELRFRIIGSGQLDSLMRYLPANVERREWVEYERLPEELHRCGCALGIFGTSRKAQRVIPNKVFQALACGAPVVTAETPAARELLTQGESALLVPPADPDALADALRRLAAEPELARRIAAGGLIAYREHASEEILGPRWRTLIEELL